MRSRWKKYAFQNALAQIFAVVSRANKYIDENEPWRLAKDETQKPRLARVLYNLLRPSGCVPVCCAPSARYHR